MSAEVPKLFQDLITAWESHHPAAVTALFTDDCMYEDVALGAINRGKAELEAFTSEVFATFPDFKLEYKAGFVADGWASWEWVMSGTHQGNSPGLPATGKPFSVRGASILELHEGKIRRNSDYWDMATFLRQVGLMAEQPG
jgi:steroid delta-isomerase-like uncharacterized protein